MCPPICVIRREGVGGGDGPGGSSSSSAPPRNSSYNDLQRGGSGRGGGWRRTRQRQRRRRLVPARRKRQGAPSGGGGGGGGGGGRGGREPIEAVFVEYSPSDRVKALTEAQVADIRGRLNVTVEVIEGEPAAAAPVESFRDMVRLLAGSPGGLARSMLRSHALCMEVSRCVVVRGKAARQLPVCRAGRIGAEIWQRAPRSAPPDNRHRRPTASSLPPPPLAPPPHPQNLHENILTDITTHKYETPTPIQARAPLPPAACHLLFACRPACARACAPRRPILRRRRRAPPRRAPAGPGHPRLALRPRHPGLRGDGVRARPRGLPSP